MGDSEPSHSTAEPTDIFQDDTIPIQSTDYLQDPSPGTSSGNIIRRVPETRVDNLSRGVIIENFTRKNEGGWDAQVTAAEVTAELVELGLAVPPQTPGQLHASVLTQDGMIENSVARFRTMLQECRFIFASFPKPVGEGENLEIDFSNVITPRGILTEGGLGRPQVNPLPPANKQETPDQPHITSDYGSEVQVSDAPETTPLTKPGQEPENITLEENEERRRGRDRDVEVVEEVEETTHPHPNKAKHSHPKNRRTSSPEWTTKGDNNGQEDRKLSPELVRAGEAAWFSHSYRTHQDHAQE